jgi:hypothetical protein
MSTNEIIAELPRLSPDELVLIKNKVDEVLKNRVPSGSEQKPEDDFLLRVAGTAEGLPADLASNHDHYLYGSPRRERE